MKIRKFLALSLSLVMMLAMSAMFISLGSAEVYAEELPMTNATYKFNPDKVDSQFEVYAATKLSEIGKYDTANPNITKLTYVSGTGFKNGSETVVSIATVKGYKQFKTTVITPAEGDGKLIAVKFRAPAKGIYVFSVNAYGTGDNSTDQTGKLDVGVLVANGAYVGSNNVTGIWGNIQAGFPYDTGYTTLGENQDAWFVIRARNAGTTVDVNFSIEVNYYCAEVVGMVGKTDDTLNPAANSGFKLLQGGAYAHGTVLNTAQSATQVTKVPEEDTSSPFYLKTGQLIAAPKSDRTVFVEFTAPTDGTYTYIYEANSWSSPGTTRHGVITPDATGFSVASSSPYWLSFEGVMNNKNTTHPNVKGDSTTGSRTPIRTVTLKAGDKIYFFASNDGAGANVTIKITMYRIGHTQGNYTYDDAEHTEYCKCCGYEYYTDEHSYDGENDKCVCGFEKPEECQHDGGNWTDGVCDDCGYECEHTNKTQKKNDTHHWNQCDLCGTQTDKAEHTYTGANCTTKGTCTCGAEGTKDAANHTGTADKLVPNSNGTHNVVYSCCDAPVNADVACTYNQTGYKCVCGNECPHNAYANGKCTSCGADHTAHTGGTATCVAKKVCETCGIEYGEVDATKHNVEGVSFTSNGNGQHVKICKDCTQPAVTENCSDGVNGTTATCMKKAVCTTCNTAYGELNPTEHDDECTLGAWEKADEATHVQKWTCGAIEGTPKAHNGTADCLNKAHCSDCDSDWGEIDEDNHVGEIAYDDNGDGTHKSWYKDCCEAVVAANEAHTGGTPTCQSGALCEKCNVAYGEKDTDNHVTGCVPVLDEEMTDDRQHFYEYKHCGTSADDLMGDHNYDAVGVCTVCQHACSHAIDEDDDGFCDTCGKDNGHECVWENGVCTNCAKVCPHTAYYDGSYTADPYGCKVCDVVCAHTTDAEEANCQSGAICEECGYAHGEVDKTNHTSEDFDYIVSDDGKTHKKVNACCGETVEENMAHTFGDDSECDFCGFVCEDHKYVDGICSICTQEHENHTGATCSNGGKCTVCGKAYTTVAHTNRSNATCTKKAVCVYCGEYGDYDYTKHTSDKVKYEVTADTHTEVHACCGKPTGKAPEAHTGTATCKEKAECTVCGTEFGGLASHKGGKATCCKKAVCTECGEEYGEVDASNHEKEVKWTITADKHSSKYECCGAVATAETAHTGGKATCEEKAKCSVCGASYGELDPTNHASKTYIWKKDGKVHSATYSCCGAVAVAEEAHDPKNCDKCGGYSAPTSDVAISIAAAIAVTGIIGFAVATKKRKH